MPGVCTASVWKYGPLPFWPVAFSNSSRLRFTIVAISSTGNSTPVSLFAHMIDTIAVSSRIAFSTSSTFSVPSAATGRRVTPKPMRSSASVWFMMAECSTCVVTMWRLPVVCSADQIAALSLSVPQLVKMISLAVAPKSAATFSRASIR